jgi:hypothetical protein
MPAQDNDALSFFDCSRLVQLRSSASLTSGVYLTSDETVKMLFHAVKGGERPLTKKVVLYVPFFQSGLRLFGRFDLKPATPCGPSSLRQLWDGLVGVGDSARYVYRNVRSLHSIRLLLKTI